LIRLLIPYNITYTWEDTGFSSLGNIFKQHGAEQCIIYNAPSPLRLSKGFVYKIVNPDIKEETLNPNYITYYNAQTIYDWVKFGGVLLLTHNYAHADFEHINILAKAFGIQFNDNSLNRFT
jgi:unsaturated rhamnogalacturonyl hydrolase